MSAAEVAARALAAVGPSDGALVTVTRERSLLLRFARSRPTQATAVDDATIATTVLRDGHVGTASTNRDDDESLAACARAAQAGAAAAARTSGPGPYPGFPAVSKPKAQHGFDAATAELDPRHGGDALATTFAVAGRHGVEAHGVWSAAEVETALASSSDGVLTDRVTDAFMKITCIADSGRSGWASATGAAIGAIDAEALAERAAARASGAFAARPVVTRLQPGEHPVVLAPAAVAELLTWLAWCAFNGLAHAEGHGALVGKLGTTVAAASIDLSDAPHHERTLPRAFDAEGVAKGPLPLIQDGVAVNVTHDTRTAALAGGDARTTGHALAPGGSPWGALPTNLVLAGGGAADEADLCAPIERGVYVTRLWYTNVVRPNQTLLTGVTRDGTFLIEDGQITAPLEDLRLTDGILGVLERTEALTAAHELWSEGEFYGRRFATGTVAPALRSTLRFSGGA